MKPPFLQPRRANSFTTGALYMVDGLRCIWHPKLRKYILIPLLANILLFVLLTNLVIGYYWTLVSAGHSMIPTWLQPWIAPIEWFVWFIVFTVLLIGYGYSFNLITNFIAAPFYGILAEATENIATGKSLPYESMASMIWRVFVRETCKLVYFLGRGILVMLIMLLVGFIPLLQVLAPLIGIAWSIWSMTIQYSDYAADNHQLPFHAMRARLAQNLKSSFGFGTAVMVCTVIPVVNIFAIPVAVVGGTLFWLNELDDVPANTKLENYKT